MNKTNQGAALSDADIAELVKDIHNAIAELAGVARYPDLTEAIERLASCAADRRLTAEQGGADLRDTIREHLTSLYVCTRVWDAWHVGTMTEDDFTPAGETDFVEDLACAIEAATHTAQPQAEPALRSALERLQWNLDLLLAGKPVRDVSETRAEVAAALATPTAQPQAEPAGWKPIESAPEGVPCVVFWREDGEGAESERYEFDWIEDGIWQNHSEHHENYLMVGGPSMGPGPKERPPYTHFRPLLPPAPTAPTEPT